MADIAVKNCICTYVSYKKNKKEYPRRSFVVSCPIHDKSHIFT